MKAMEHHTEPPFAGVFVTIILTAFSWFMNFISHADALMQLLLHFVQLLAAMCAVLVALTTLIPPLKSKIIKFFRSFF